MKSQSREYRCALVENEPLAIDMMLEYIGQRNELKLVHVIETLDACEILLGNNEDIDILFLDIKIQGGELFDFFGRLADRSFTVVMITAYALQDLDALPQSFLRYFIPKPISLQAFNNCLDKILLEDGV